MECSPRGPKCQKGLGTIVVYENYSLDVLSMFRNCIKFLYNYCQKGLGTTGVCEYYSLDMLSM